LSFDRSVFKYYAIRFCLSFVVLLATLEIGLQVAAIVLPAFLVRSGNQAALSDEVTILCVGDSHTYGSPLPREDAYPAQLEEGLNLESPDRHFSVVNLGLPGQNSAMVSNRLEKQVATYEPSLIIVWVGLNSRWNFNEFDVDREGSWLIELRQWILKSKVLRLIIVSGFRDGAPGSESADPLARPERLDAKRVLPGVQRWEMDGEIVEIPAMTTGDETPTEDAIRVQREGDYAAMIATARARDVPLIFITYPAEILTNHLITNMAIRKQAERFGIPVLSSFLAFQEALSDGYTPGELLVNAVGPHPTRILHGYVVKRLRPLVLQLLADSCPDACLVFSFGPHLSIMRA
jgi:hypothetical protein